MSEGIVYLAFTEKGKELAGQISTGVGGSVYCTRDAEDFSLYDWTRRMFSEKEALVFIGAAGIAVRAVAPFLDSKARDPAVISVDESGSYIIPLASGHLGGAHSLAKQIASVCGGTAVVTTATDIRGVFAVDSWAKRQGMAVCKTERIKKISSKLLAGNTVTISSPWAVKGDVPEGVVLTQGPADAAVTFRDADALCLIPKCLVLGIGCRRGISQAEMERAFRSFCRERGILEQAVREAASISLKKEEEGLLSFCRSHGWPIRFYSADELRGAQGEFTPSAFVEKTVGIDNVCERSAVLTAGGVLCEKKYTGEGITFAAAFDVPELDWRW